MKWPKSRWLISLTSVEYFKLIFNCSFNFGSVIFWKLKNSNSVFFFFKTLDKDIFYILKLNIDDINIERIHYWCVFSATCFFIVFSIKNYFFCKYISWNYLLFSSKSFCIFPPYPLPEWHEVCISWNPNFDFNPFSPHSKQVMRQGIYATLRGEMCRKKKQTNWF